tara:strand:- start:6748 stop:6936 length:189 start_codon:yes stop_codon:yes gene_type:complete
MFVYIVILIHMGGYKVHAPNAVFTTEKHCLVYKEMDYKRLYYTAPDPYAEIVSLCIKLPEKV